MSVYIGNVSNVPVPNPKGLTIGEQAILEGLQERAHLKKAKVAHDGKGNAIILAMPLATDERAIMDDLAERVRDQHMAVIGGQIEFRFSPRGQAGSIYEVEGQHAQLLLKQHPTRLAILDEETVWSERNKVRPLRRTGIRLAVKTADTLAEARQREISREMDGDGHSVASLGVTDELQGYEPTPPRADSDLE